MYKFKTMLTTMMWKFYGLIHLNNYFVIGVLKHISDIGHNKNELRKKFKMPIVLIYFTDFHKSIIFSLIYQWFVFCLVCGIFCLYLYTITNSATWCDFRKSKSIYTMIIIHLFLFEIGNVLELVLHLIQAHKYLWYTSTSYFILCYKQLEYMFSMQIKHLWLDKFAHLLFFSNNDHQLSMLCQWHDIRFLIISNLFETAI